MIKSLLDTQQSLLASRNKHADFNTKISPANYKSETRNSTIAMYYELPEDDSPPSFGRMGFGKSAESEFSMNLDDICGPISMERARSKDFSSFSLSCWEEGDEDAHNESNFNGSNKYIDMGSSRLERLDNGKRNNNSLALDYYCVRNRAGDDELNAEEMKTRKVHFDLEPEIHEIERADLDDYPMLYYCVHELQKMADEFQHEENDKRRVIR